MYREPRASVARVISERCSCSLPPLDDFSQHLDALFWNQDKLLGIFSQKRKNFSAKKVSFFTHAHFSFKKCNFDNSEKFRNLIDEQTQTTYLVVVVVEEQNGSQRSHFKNLLQLERLHHLRYLMDYSKSSATIYMNFVT